MPKGLEGFQKGHKYYPSRFSKKGIKRPGSGRKNGWFTGEKHSEKTKQKMRISAFEYAKKIVGIICPRVGHNEREILDRLEKELGYRVLRQYKICGYYLDGYIPELKLAIEVDEMPKVRNKDI